MPGLCESVQQKWSGDVDLNTGELQRSYQMYQTELIFISEIGLRSRQCRSMILQDLKELHNTLSKTKILQSQVRTRLIGIMSSLL